MEKMYRLVCLLILVIAGGVHAGITFSGIDGANSWVWVEAEDGTLTGGDGSKWYFGSSLISGYNATPAPRDGVEAWFDGGAYTWTATVPSTMVNAKLYAHCSSYFTDYRPFTIEKDGQTLGYIWNNQGTDASDKDPIYWSGTTDASRNPSSLGTLNQGDVTLTLREDIYNSMRFDGFFLTNGAMDLSNPPTTALDASGYYWMQRPTFAGPLPVLTGPLTPVVNGAPTGVQYFVYRDGTQVSSSSSSFGVLDISGNYDLEIRGANNDILCGASFKLIIPPPPVISGLAISGIDGAISWVWVEAEDGTRISGSGWVEYFGANASGHSGVETWFDDAAYTWTAAVPSTMNNAKLYARCSSYYTASWRPFSIEIYGQTLGYIWNTQGTDESFKAPIYWSETTDASRNPSSLMALNQGDVTLTLKEGIYNSMRFDGFFLTNGTIDLSNPPTTALDASGYYWMQRPTFAETLPEIQGPVTPVVANASAGAKYFINGTEYLDGFGTLNTNGTYHLEIRESNNRLMAGADFTVIGVAPSADPEIPSCVTIAVDGNLSDWSDVNWIALNKNYDGAGATADVPEAAYAAKWNVNGDKVYVAVKVRDTAHTFSSDYGSWNGRDAVEVYLHTTGTGTAYYQDQDSAQQYAVGIKSGTTDQVWTSLTDTNTMPASAGFVAAGKVVGEWIYYEVAMTPFEYFGGISGQPSVVSALKTNDQIGLDVCVVGNNGSYTGMKSANGMLGKDQNWEKFQVQKLVAGLIPGDANGDGAVDVGDLGILAANYGGSGKTRAQGDFNGDGLVDVGDLGILAAHYGEGSINPTSFSDDYNTAFGTTVSDDTENDATTGGSICGVLGLPLLAGLMLAGLMLLGSSKLED